jgi:hypothetical protein
MLLPFSHSSVGSALTTRSKWEDEAIEEGTDVAAELDSPPLPLRPSSDWLHRQFSGANPMPNIHSIMATPLSPPFTNHFNQSISTANATEVVCQSQPKTSFIDQIHKKHKEHHQEESNSPPKMFYCSPPSSPPPPETDKSKSACMLIFDYSKDETDMADCQHLEEGFFEADCEEDYYDEEEEELNSNSSVNYLRKRKTTGNGAGLLAVLEKRPCCDEEDEADLDDNSVAIHPNQTEEEEASDGDSGVDVNGALVMEEIPDEVELKLLKGDLHKPKHCNKLPGPAVGDQTVPEAEHLKTPLEFL